MRTHIYLYHFAVHQKLTQHCKSTTIKKKTKTKTKTQKQTHRHRKQIYGYQRGEGRRERQIRSMGLEDINYYT